MSIPSGASTFFSPDIRNDPWMVFHGTSSISEVAIDEHGLRRTASAVSTSEIQAVVEVYRQLNWDGGYYCRCGFGVLSAYTACDVSQVRGRPTYLGESDLRCFVYATRDFAAGEAARAVEYAIRDLETLAADSCAQWEPSVGGSPHSPPTSWDDVDGHGVLTALEELSPIRERLQALRARHTHGVIYALRLRPADLTDLEWHSSRGVLCFRDLPHDRLVAKRIVSEDEAEPAVTDTLRARRHIDNPLRDYAQVAAAIRAALPDSEPDAAAIAESAICELESAKLGPHARRDVVHELCANAAALVRRSRGSSG